MSKTPGGTIADWWTPPEDDAAPPNITDVDSAIAELRTLGYVVVRGGDLGPEHQGMRHVANAAWVAARGHNPEASQTVGRVDADATAWHAGYRLGKSGVHVQPNNAFRFADEDDWFVFLP